MSLQGKQFKVTWLDQELTDIDDYISYRNGTGTVQELDKDKDKDNDKDNDNVKDNDSGYRKFRSMRKDLFHS